MLAGALDPPHRRDGHERQSHTGTLPRPGHQRRSVPVLDRVRVATSGAARQQAHALAAHGPHVPHDPRSPPHPRGQPPPRLPRHRRLAGRPPRGRVVPVLVAVSNGLRDGGVRVPLDHRVDLHGRPHVPRLLHVLLRDHVERQPGGQVVEHRHAVARAPRR